MNERILWERFKKTGRISDYLAYAECKTQTINHNHDKAVLSNAK